MSAQVQYQIKQVPAWTWILFSADPGADILAKLKEKFSTAPAPKKAQKLGVHTALYTKAPQTNEEIDAVLSAAPAVDAPAAPAAPKRKAAKKAKTPAADTPAAPAAPAADAPAADAPAAPKRKAAKKAKTPAADTPAPADTPAIDAELIADPTHGF